MLCCCIIVGGGVVFGGKVVVMDLMPFMIEDWMYGWVFSVLSCLSRFWVYFSRTRVMCMFGQQSKWLHVSSHWVAVSLLFHLCSIVIVYYSLNLGFCHNSCAPVLFSQIIDGVECFYRTVFLDMWEVMFEIICSDNFDGVGWKVLDIRFPWSFFVCCFTGIRWRSSGIGWEECLVGRWYECLGSIGYMIPSLMALFYPSAYRSCLGAWFYEGSKCRGPYFPPFFRGVSNATPFEWAIAV